MVFIKMLLTNKKSNACKVMAKRRCDDLHTE